MPLIQVETDVEQLCLSRPTLKAPVGYTRPEVPLGLFLSWLIP